MSGLFDPVESFWEDLLSEQPEQVLEAYHAIDAETRQAVLLHLERMTTEEGWHPMQRASAQTAIAIIHEYKDSPEG